ncbi:phosphotransferase [Streptomyces olivoreticuli]|uniref:phosphotransferase n=1 Tax=Streptomyces olivoreticuli TaxID=68246 RepID=UPI00265A1A2D|nr:phosphotransferase [Streptomyces olivoreticuli]WKK26432.1 phosphotransferase [Streptomyces olivoreticuli]
MRVDWATLPEALRAAIEQRSGAVRAVQDIPHGITCRFAAALRTRSGAVFVKGVPVGDERGRAAQAREVAVSGAVPGAVGPRFLWQVIKGGWDVVGFAWVDGRHADLAPGSGDLPLVADVLRKAQALRAPANLSPLADRWSDLGDEDRALLAGETLLHTDTNPHNLLVGAERAWLIDWAMPASGPAWVDVAYTAVRLMESGHAPGDALAWAGPFPCWRTADPRAVAVFVEATCRQWSARVGVRGARPSNERFAALL